MRAQAVLCTSPAWRRRVKPQAAMGLLVRFECVRARAWYQRGLALLPHLDRRSRACTAAMAGIYRRLLYAKIKEYGLGE